MSDPVSPSVVSDLSSSLQSLPGQTGFLLLDLGGAIVCASGELKDASDNEKQSKLIRQILLEARGLIDSNDPLKRISIAFKSYHLSIFLTHSLIAVVKTAVE